MGKARSRNDGRLLRIKFKVVLVREMNFASTQNSYPIRVYRKGGGLHEAGRAIGRAWGVGNIGVRGAVL